MLFYRLIFLITGIRLCVCDFCKMAVMIICNYVRPLRKVCLETLILQCYSSFVCMPYVYVCLSFVKLVQIAKHIIKLNRPVNSPRYTASFCKLSEGYRFGMTEFITFYYHLTLSQK